MPDPNVGAVIKKAERNTGAVRGDSWMDIGLQLGQNGVLLAVPTNPRERVAISTDHARDIDQ